ncbi:MAG: DUF4954 family protein [Bacteroidota bacterium]
MKAVIMAGGFGTRLRPLTCNIPKPIVPVMNKPMMQHIIELLHSHGITDLVATLFYQPEVITRYFGDGSKFGVSLRYVKAEADYGTAGSVRNASPLLNDRFVIISGDVLTDCDLTEAIRFHEERKARATLVLTRVKNPLQYGVVITNKRGKITRFLEKPSWGEVFSDTVNTGIYILEPSVMELIPTKEDFDFSKNLFPFMMEQDLGLYGYISDRYWRDIGTLNEYQDVHLDYLHGKVHVAIEGTPTSYGFLGEGSTLHTSQKNLTGKVVIGKGCTIHENVRLHNVVVGDGTIIYAGASLHNAVVWSHVKIGERTEISNDVIGSDCVIGSGAVIDENVFISDHCYIGQEAHLSANIKLWPEKVIEDRATLSRSLIWEDRWLRELFTDSRITGLSNIEMTPEFGSRLGAAFGAYVGSGKTVIVSRDSDNVSRMMNRAVMAGLMSAGVNIYDLRTVSIPVLRHELAQSGTAEGGIHTRKSPFDKHLTDIIVFENTGKDLPVGKTRAIERLFLSEDFRRAEFSKVGSMTFSDRASESYRDHFIKRLKIEQIKKANFKIVIDYSNGVASTIFPTILGLLNCQVVALNAYLDPAKLTRTSEEFEASVKQLSDIVLSLKYDIGLMIDAGGEKLSLVDDRGELMSQDRFLTIVLKLFLASNPDTKKVAVPITATREVDLIAQEYGVTVIRTKDNHYSMMDVISDPGISFVGGTKGGFIFPDFLKATDGMFAMAKILELMAISGLRLAELDQTLPRLRFVKKSISCAWDYKGKVMRNIMKETEHMRRDLIDGVKIYFEPPESFASILLLPDRERPLFHINVEARDWTTAKQLSDEYERKFLKWRDA